jgi:4-hydroxybenzoate polyprenyltransferase
MIGASPEPDGRARHAVLWAYLQLVRLPNLFTAMADVAMGYLFTHPDRGSVDGWVLGSLLGASVLLYSAGVVLNDVFDVEIDRRERPGRPIPSGRISLERARYLGFRLLPGGLILAWLAVLAENDFRPGVVAMLLAACVVLYDGRLKRTPLGPPAMGACRALNVLLGMSLVEGSWQAVHLGVAGAIGTYIAGVTWFARTEARPSSRFQLGLATAVILAGIGALRFVPGWTERVAPLLMEQSGRWPLLIGLLALLIGFRCCRAVADPSPCRVQPAVRLCILTLIVLDAALTFVVQGPWPAVAVLVLLVPATTLGRWFAST